MASRCEESRSLMLPMRRTTFPVPLFSLPESANTPSALHSITEVNISKSREEVHILISGVCLHQHIRRDWTDYVFYRFSQLPHRSKSLHRGRSSKRGLFAASLMSPDGINTQFLLRRAQEFGWSWTCIACLVRSSCWSTGDKECQQN